MEIPYCILKGKSRLGAIVHQKIPAVKNEDKMEFSRILEAVKANFNDKYEEYRKKWGGGIMGSKSQAKTKAKESSCQRGCICFWEVNYSCMLLIPVLPSVIFIVLKLLGVMALKSLMSKFSYVIHEYIGWGWGLGIPLIVVFVFGYPLYRNMDPSGSPFTWLVQVCVAAYKKRNLPVVSGAKMLYENEEHDASISVAGRLLHTEQMK
ncbi:putative 50S ribosomal protein L30e [Helianthus anomalus]